MARGEELLFQAQESVEGFIADDTRGENGFGYDPLFFYPPFGRTFGEVPREEKDRVSHRGRPSRGCGSSWPAGVTKRSDEPRGRRSCGLLVARLDRSSSE